MRLSPRTRRPLLGGAIITVVVVLFTRFWHDGHTTLDGNGVVLYADLAARYSRSGGIPYWIPDMWTGTPIWALAPIFPVLMLIPLARMFGAEPGVRYFTVLLQIAGGWGAMVLAASIWHEERRQQPGRAGGETVNAVNVAAVVAGCLYALSPIVISHGTLFGHETTIAVLAAAPWLVWSLRHGLRGDGRKWVILAGAITAFAILDQAEHAYALVIICALVVVGQLARSVDSGGGWGERRARLAARAVVVRAGGVVAVAGGLLAHWLIPLRALSGAFILSPPDVVSASLTSGIGAQLANEPGAFVTRGPGLAKVVTYGHPDILRAGSFYLGWVWIIGSAVALLILALRPRRDRDGTLAGLLLAAALCLWMSTAATPLARSGPGVRHEWVALAVIGGLGGLCIGVFFRRLAVGRVVLILGVVSVLVLFAVPYLTPFLVLQKLIPLAGNLRLPRLYPLAVLGLSLGAAYPITLVDRAMRHPRMGRQQVRIVQFGAIAAGVALLGVSIVDIWPYRTFYRTRPPEGSAQYQFALAGVPNDGGRLITEQFGDPRIVEEMYKSGLPMATGWPHPVANKDVWPLVVTPQEAAPAGYRDTAASLASSSGLLVEHSVALAQPTTAAQAAAEAKVVTNPKFAAPDVPPGAVEIDRIHAEPEVRAYDSAVVVDPDASPTTEIAVGLVPDHVSVVRGGATEARELGPIAVGGAPQQSTCSSYGGETSDGFLGAQLGVACAMHRWVGKYVGLNQTVLGPGIGAVFAAADGLQGVALWMLGPTTGVQIAVRQQTADGSLGQTLFTVPAGTNVDRYGMTPFTFPQPLPAGRYSFEATCPSCKGTGNDAPRLIFTEASPGNVIVADRLVTDLVAAFTPVYARTTPAPASTATLRTVKQSPGSMDITVHADKPQLVVVAQADFPGWHAKVDGHSSPVLNADSAFVGVVVPAGDHTITLRYRAPGVTEGDWISALTVLVCLGIVLKPTVWPRIQDARRTVRRARTPATGA